MFDNQTFGTVRVNPAMEWRYYDSLSPRLRRLVQRAPYNFALKGLAQTLASQGERAAEARFIERVFLVRDAALRKEWPAGHPMIGARAGSRI